MKINLYDFDQTIYDGDSTRDFFFYELKKNPMIIVTLFETGLFGLLYLLHIVSKTKMKEHFYKFLRYIKSVDADVLDFWRSHDSRIKKFYLEKDHSNDIIISASPEFLLLPICNKLKVKDMMASRVNKYTGKTSGLNCHDVEKVRRLNEKYDNYVVMEAYSDSVKSDRPILELAKKAYVVKGENLTDF